MPIDTNTWTITMELADGQKIDFDKIKVFSDIERTSDMSTDYYYDDNGEDLKEKFRVEAPSDSWTKKELLEYIEKQTKVLNNREKQLQEQKSRNAYDTELMQHRAELMGIRETRKWVKDVLNLLGDIQNGREQD